MAGSFGTAWSRSTPKATPRANWPKASKPSPARPTWIFNIRKGIPFTSGKTLDADDVIYSLNLHRGETKSGAKDLLSSITEIKKLDTHQIQFTLSSGDASFPSVFADYHILIVPNGFTDFSKPDGTGAFTLESFEPGVRVLTKNKGHYWKPRSRQFRQRRVALYSGCGGAHSGADFRPDRLGQSSRRPSTVSLVMKAPTVNVVRSKGTGNRFAFVALATRTPTPTTTFASPSNTASIVRRSSTPSIRASRRWATTRPSRRRRSISPRISRSVPTIRTKPLSTSRRPAWRMRRWSCRFPKARSPERRTPRSFIRRR